MFIKTLDYTLNTDHIIYAEVHSNGSTSLYLSNGSNIPIFNAEEARQLWGYLNRQTLSVVIEKEKEKGKDPKSQNIDT